MRYGLHTVPSTLHGMLVGCNIHGGDDFTAAALLNSVRLVAVAMQLPTSEAFSVHVSCMCACVHRWKQLVHRLAVALLESVGQGIVSGSSLLSKLGVILLNALILGWVMQNNLHLDAYQEWLRSTFRKAPCLILGDISPSKLAMALSVPLLLHFMLSLQTKQRGVQHCSQREALVMVAGHNKAHAFDANILAKLADHPLHRTCLTPRPDNEAPGNRVGVLALLFVVGLFIFCAP